MWVSSHCLIVIVIIVTYIFNTKFIVILIIAIVRSINPPHDSLWTGGRVSPTMRWAKRAVPPLLDFLGGLPPTSSSSSFIIMMMIILFLQIYVAPEKILVESKSDFSILINMSFHCGKFTTQFHKKFYALLILPSHASPPFILASLPFGCKLPPISTKTRFFEFFLWV